MNRLFLCFVVMFVTVALPLVAMDEGGLDGVFFRLQHQNPRVNQATLAELRSLKLDKAGILAVVRAADRSYPDAGEWSIPARMLQSLEGKVGVEWSEEFSRELRTVFPKLKLHHNARRVAMKLLFTEGGLDGITSFCMLVKTAEGQHANLDMALSYIEDKPDAAMMVVPVLLDNIEGLRNQLPVYSLVLRCLQAKKMDLVAFPEFAKHCVGNSLALIKKRSLQMAAFVKKLESEPGLPENLPDGFFRDYSCLEMLLWILAYVDRPETDTVLRGAVKLESSKLAAAAMVSMIVRGITPDEYRLRSLCERPFARAIVFAGLKKHNKLSFFPKSFYNQESLAEAELVSWLAESDKFSCPPREVVLLGKVDQLDADGIMEHVFVFKFRHAALSSGNWLLGWAGPYTEGKGLSLDSGMTYSYFSVYGDKGYELQFDKEYERLKREIVERLNKQREEK